MTAMTAKIVQISSAPYGDKEEIDDHLYALDSDGVVHVWEDNNTDFKKSGWRKLGGIDVRYEK
jgi:hypothetical protein